MRASERGRGDSRPRRRRPLGERRCGRGGPHSGTMWMCRTQRRTAHAGVAALLRCARLSAGYEFDDVQSVIGLAGVVPRASGQTSAASRCPLAAGSRVTFDPIAFDVVRRPSTYGSLRLRRRLRRPVSGLVGAMHERRRSYANGSSADSGLVAPGVAGKLPSTERRIAALGTGPASLSFAVAFAACCHGMKYDDSKEESIDRFLRFERGEFTYIRVGAAVVRLRVFESDAPAS